MRDPSKPPKSAISSIARKTSFELFISVVIVFVCVGSPPPGINESHYLPKAKRVWDPTFASGNDLFLNSNDSHFVASFVAGQLSKQFEFETVAWIGRLSCWMMLVLAWYRLANSLRLSSLLRPLTLAGWILLVRYGHFAGEWFVGGFEAKALAYPFVVLGLSLMIEHRWNWAWVCLGIASSLHPVVGGWAIISLLPIWFSLFKLPEGFKRHWPGIIVGAGISLIGVVPALVGLGSPDREGPISAAQVHAYLRLAHHMCPRMFEFERWWAASGTVALFVVAIMVWHSLVSNASRPSHGATQLHSSWWQGWLWLIDQPLGKIIAVACTSILISLMGWSIDMLGSLSGQTILAAKLLRFYWFRWSDVAVPLAVAVLIGWSLTRVSYETVATGIQKATAKGTYYLFAALSIIGVLIFLHWRYETTNLLAPADRMIMERVGPFPVRHDHADLEHLIPQRLQDWLAVCAWIRENTPNDSLWLTPKYQQTFKWYAQRAEVVSWKDVPQDNASIIEWYRRSEESDQPDAISCAPPHSADGTFRGWKTEELIALAKKYRFNWILLDRTYQDLPPLLECKYPLDIDNRSFAIFYVSDAMLNRK